MQRGVRIVVGVDGAGRTHRLDAIVAGWEGPSIRLNGSEAVSASSMSLVPGPLVAVDDVHRLDPAALRALTAAVRRGVDVVITRRPRIEGPDLAELDEVVASSGEIEHVRPLGDEAMAVLVARTTGRPAERDHVAFVLAESAGYPALAVPLAGTASRTTEPPPALVARVQRSLALLPPGAGALAAVLALGVALTDDALAAAAGLPPDQLAAAAGALEQAGLVEPGGERLVPVVGRALTATLAAAERRRLHDAIARGLLDSGADPVAAAVQLRAARAAGPLASGAYRAAGDRLRFEDPEAALLWYDDAVASGADPADVAAGRGEAAALLGRPGPLDDRPGGQITDRRLTIVDGVQSASDGRSARAVASLLAAGGEGPLLAVPGLVALGRLPEARNAASGTPGAPRAVIRLAEAALLLPDGPPALPAFIEAAEELATGPALVLPDSPQAIGALAASLVGDVAVAEHLLGAAFDRGAGGPATRERHRLLLAWVRLRAGRYDTAAQVARQRPPGDVAGRERLLRAAIAAGLARRSGDIARLREVWGDVEPLLARRAVDLLQLEQVEELVVAAARLRQQHRIVAILDDLDSMVAGLGSPPTWRTAAGWIRLQVALADEDGSALRQVADELSSLRPPAPRQQAQLRAASVWANLLDGTPSPDEVTAAGDELARCELPWEASRLVGQAAIRVADAAAARRLLERARELSSAEAGDPSGEHATGGLSERELEIARYVLAGRTHREIGAQLYIAPKTVEHHVARIRTKLGVTSRAEFLAALRELFAAEDG